MADSRYRRLLDEAYPALEDDTGVFWYRPDFINRHLGLTPPTLN